MKRLISLLVALFLCLSLCACSGATKLSAEDVENALENCNGTLEMETSEEKVTSFTYVVEDVNATDLLDKEYSRDAIATVMTGDTSQITVGQMMASEAYLPLMSIAALLEEGKGEFDSDDFLEKLLGVVCDGDTADYNGWTVSASVDQANDSITILVNSK